MAEKEFSYASDVAPYASRYFDRVASDPRLSHASKMQLQGTLLNGMEDIQSQRLKLQKERDEGRRSTMALETQSNALEDSRAARARRENDLSQRAGVKGAFNEVLNGEGTPEEKRQRLNQIGMQHSDIISRDAGVSQAYEFATKALPQEPKGGMTPGQIAAATEKLYGSVDPEVLPEILSNPFALGAALSTVAQREKAAEEAKKLREEKSEEAEARKLDLAKLPLKFAKPDPASGETEARWLEPASTERAEKIISVLGTPEEQAQFLRLKSADSDEARAILIEKIQLRHRFDTEGPKTDGAKSRVRSLSGLNPGG